jgi:hypothetical protein
MRNGRGLVLDERLNKERSGKEGPWGRHDDAQRNGIVFCWKGRLVLVSCSMKSHACMYSVGEACQGRC